MGIPLRDHLVRFIQSTAFDRLFSLAALAPSLALLVVAARLEPDPAGMGTHRQLGLGPCTFLTLTGWPCPTCGMTTCFSLAAHGRFLDAFLNQPFGLVLFVVDLAVVVVALLELAAPRGRWRRIWAWLMEREGTVALLLLLGMGVGWAVKLWHTFG